MILSSKWEPHIFKSYITRYFYLPFLLIKYSFNLNFLEQASALWNSNFEKMYPLSATQRHALANCTLPEMYFPLEKIAASERGKRLVSLRFVSSRLRNWRVWLRGPPPLLTAKKNIELLRSCASRGTNGCKELRRGPTPHKVKAKMNTREEKQKWKRSRSGKEAEPGGGIKGGVSTREHR